jgi:hypothetical protein
MAAAFLCSMGLCGDTCREPVAWKRALTTSFELSDHWRPDSTACFADDGYCVQKAEELATHIADTHFELLQQEVQARQDLAAQLDALQSAEVIPAAGVIGSTLADAPAGGATSAHVHPSDACVELQPDGNVAKPSAAISSCASEART